MTPYEALLARLLPARRFGIVLGLERMHEIFQRLGHPEVRLGRVIHVGGTNGKGSTVAMIAHLLRSEGARVATYTSPHLSCLRERICFDGELISEQAIVEAAGQVTAARGDELTFFEQLTAIACVAIAARGVDFTVLEVGLGGRLDATNAVPAEVAVVTGVAMDHEAILGDTLAQIAAEKAGIFKPGQNVVIGASGEPDAVPFLIAAAHRAGARARVIDEAAIDLVREPATTHLGAYQQRNAAAARAAVELLDRWVMRAALQDVRLPPGRFEIIETSLVDYVLDGAHNPHAALALAAELRTRSIRPTIIAAVSSDKHVEGVVRALAPVAHAVIATRYRQDRSLAPEALAAAFASAGASVETAPELTSALARAVDPRGFAPSVIHPRPTVLVTGSLFLVGEARSQLLGAPTDPYVVTDPPAKT